MTSRHTSSQLKNCITPPRICYPPSPNSLSFGNFQLELHECRWTIYRHIFFSTHRFHSRSLPSHWGMSSVHYANSVRYSCTVSACRSLSIHSDPPWRSPGKCSAAAASRPANNGRQIRMSHHRRQCHRNHECCEILHGRKWEYKNQ